VEVDTITLDSFLLEKGIPHIDILKLDVQGSEFDVFKGAAATLSRQGISLIRKLHEHLAFLDSFGYELLDFFGDVRIDKQLIQTDLILLSSSFKSGRKIS